jgi:hypothetical protein
MSKYSSCTSYKDVPPSKAECRELEVVPDFPFAVEPPLRIELVRVGIDIRIA